MTLNKKEKLKFIINGRMVILECRYWGLIFDKVPAYKSSMIRDIVLIENRDGTLFIILNDEYYKKNREKAELKVYNSILKTKYRDNVSICDICTAFEFGFLKTMEMIKALGIDKDNRIKVLEGAFKKRETLSMKIPSKASILDSLNYVEVKESTSV